MYGDFPARNTVCTPYITINVWFWPTLVIRHQMCLQVYQLKAVVDAQVQLHDKAHISHWLARTVFEQYHTISDILCMNLAQCGSR